LWIGLVAVVQSDPDFSRFRLEPLLQAGEEVWISKWGKPFARIVLGTPPSEARPDFAARFGPEAKIQAVATVSGRPLKDFLKGREEER
jgi:antitoxin (DNA-binding transcriptional repressor) of toxin-antitoxin stability system